MVKMPSDRGYLTNFTQKLIPVFDGFGGSFTEKEKKNLRKKNIWLCKTNFGRITICALQGTDSFRYKAR